MHFYVVGPRIHQAKRFAVERKLLETLPRVFQRLTNTLEHIEFRGVTFYDWTPIVTGIQSLTVLKRLYLRGCNLKDAGLGKLCKVVRNLAINQLQVSDCDITHKG